MMLAALLVALSADVPVPTPSASPLLKTIIIERTTPLCSTLKNSVLDTITGLQANDRVVERSKPVLLQMGKDYIPISEVGKPFGKKSANFGGAHDPSPALLLDNQHLEKLIGAIVHNLAVLDAILNDPTRWPAQVKTDDERAESLLKSQLQAVADQQRETLNTLSGLSATLSLQQLVAAGDGLQGTANGGGAAGGQVGQSDQDISFQDILSASDRGRGAYIDPTVDTDPAISVAPTDLTNSPLLRFYWGVSAEQKNTASAEQTLTQTVVADAATCR
jgi:hypothetical protein